MPTSWDGWLAGAADVLEDAAASDEVIDATVTEGLMLEDAGGLDPVKVERVIACLQARRAALAVELADLSRRRSELLRARIATTGYLNAGAAVPMQ